IIADGTVADLKRGLERERLEIGFAADDGYARALESLTTWPDLQGRAVHQDAATRTIGVATDGSADQVRDVLDRLAASGIEVPRVRLVTPSLDEVFLTLTGDPGPSDHT